MNWLKELKNNFNILDIKFEKVETYCDPSILDANKDTENT